MSRLPLSDTWEPKSENVSFNFLDFDVGSAITSVQIQQKTRVDPVLSRAHSYLLHGWPNKISDPSFMPYSARKSELSVDHGCVLRGARVIVPPVLQEQVLTELHDTHPGMTKMKAIARSYVWWPNVDSDIERMVSKCDVCQELRSLPAKASVHPWVFPSSPWSRIHVDFAGPVSGHTYLVIVDAYSKFPEIVKMNNITSTATIKVLRQMFSRYGVPEMVVSDNGPQLVSQEFEQFCTMNGIVHRTSAVYKPATNGQAERVVQILKTAIKQAELSNEDVDSYIQRYLLRYRITPHSTTGESPSMLLMGRRLRTRLDLILPAATTKLIHNRQEQKVANQSGVRTFNVGDKVSVQNFIGSRKWISGSIVSVLGARHYLVNVGNDTNWK